MLQARAVLFFGGAESKCLRVLKIVLAKWATQVYDTLDPCDRAQGQTHSSYTSAAYDVLWARGGGGGGGGLLIVYPGLGFVTSSTAQPHHPSREYDLPHCPMRPVAPPQSAVGRGAPTLRGEGRAHGRERDRGDTLSGEGGFTRRDYASPTFH